MIFVWSASDGRTVASEALGHTSTAFTVDVHVMPSIRDLVAAAWKEAFSEASGKESGSKP